MTLTPVNTGIKVDRVTLDYNGAGELILKDKAVDLNKLSDVNKSLILKNINNN